MAPEVPEVPEVLLDLLGQSVPPDLSHPLDPLDRAVPEPWNLPPEDLPDLLDP